MNLETLRTKYKGEILRIAAARGVSNVRVFGSVATGKDNENSDVDFLISTQPKTSLLKIGGFYADLSDLLGVKIDVVLDDSIKLRIRERVLNEAVPL